MSILEYWDSDMATWSGIEHKDVVSGTLVRIYEEDETPDESHEAMAIADAEGSDETTWFFEVSDV